MLRRFCTGSTHIPKIKQFEDVLIGKAKYICYLLVLINCDFTSTWLVYSHLDQLTIDRLIWLSSHKKWLKPFFLSTSTKAFLVVGRGVAFFISIIWSADFCDYGRLRLGEVRRGGRDIRNQRWGLISIHGVFFWYGGFFLLIMSLSAFCFVAECVNMPLSTQLTISTKVIIIIIKIKSYILEQLTSAAVRRRVMQ